MRRPTLFSQLSIAAVGVLMAVGIALLLPRAAAAQPPGGFGPSRPAGPCGALQDADFSNIPGAPAAISSTQIVSATGTQPEYCEVSGLISSQIQFQLWLPTSGWNNRYLQVGCGGYCGSLDPSDECYQGLAQNFAVGFDNSGHIGTMDGDGNALWAYDNLGLREDFGYRSEHVTSQVAKAIIASFYGKDVSHAYYFGCSNGGRQALQVAQSWPEDFDGVVAGAPAAIQAPLNGEYEPWNGLANLDADGNQIIGQAQLQLLNNAALTNCDALDGLKDGQITDPRRCTFDPTELLCKAGQSPTATAGITVTGPMTGMAPLGNAAEISGELPVTGAAPLAGTGEITGASAMTGSAPAGLPPLNQAVAPATCLTQAQVDAAHKLYSGPVTADGKALYPGHEAVGSELGWQGWTVAFAPGMPPMAYGIGDGYLKYLAFPKSPAPSYSVKDWKFDIAGFDSLREMGKVYNATDPDLSAFRDRGGKLILYHGWADPAISPFGTLAYYQAVQDTMGGLAKTQKFARLFMVPGMFHCSGGNAPNTFDLLSPIQDWVENGVAPAQIIATQYAGSGESGGFSNPTAGGSNQGQVVRTRPLCPFPQEQTYDGKGDINDAASFSCELPKEETLHSGAYDWVGNDLFQPVPAVAPVVK